MLEALDGFVHPETLKNPMSLLRWTSKYSTKLAEELVGRGFEVSSRTLLRLLHQLGYSLQANAKVTEGLSTLTVMPSSDTSTTWPRASSMTTSQRSVSVSTPKGRN